jgi:Tetratricopeptide repeat
MDCRKGLLFCLGLLVPLSGCVREVRTGGEDKGGEQVIKKPETFVAFADMRVGSAFAPETPPEAQQVYREEARSNYLRAIEINPNYVPAYLKLARLQQGTHDMAAALETYQKALEVTPKDSTIWYELGMCQARQKQFAEAVASFKKACKLHPDDKTYQETLGYTLARAGRWAESLTELTAIVGDARAHFMLGRMLQHLEQPEQARQYVAAALSRDPNLPGGRDLLVTLGGAPPTDAVQRVEYTPPQVAPTPATPLPVVRVVPEGVTGIPVAAPTDGAPAPQGIRLPPRPVIGMQADAH